MRRPNAHEGPRAEPHGNGHYDRSIGLRHYGFASIYPSYQEELGSRGLDHVYWMRRHTPSKAYGSRADRSQVPLLILSIITTIGSYYGIGAKDSTFARPGNQKYVETAYFVSSSHICASTWMQANSYEWFFLYEIFYCTSIIFVKLSIAFMLNRIAGRRMLFIYTNYGIMALCASANLGAALYIIFQCNPVEYVNPIEAFTFNANIL
jgi:hypothetical protein